MSLKGRRVGNYEFGAELGRGGMGTVYRATSLEEGPAGPAGTEVAIKLFNEELIEDEVSFRRFEREAALGLEIRHPNVVPSYETVSLELDGAPAHFIVMQLVEGQTLRELITELGTLPDSLLYQVADQALDGLSAVHAVGMIHRDVKPENFILTSDHQLKVMDLGVARLQQEGRDLTRAGEFIGSLHYASPEQFTNQDHVDPLADLYSFGVVLYELATGHNPFGTADLSQLLQLKLGGQLRRPKLVRRDVDPFLDEVILTCLRTDPAERFGSCEELRAVLREGERSEWWQSRIHGLAFPAAERALKRLRAAHDAELTGRDEQLDRLHAAYERVRTGAGRLLLVTGRAGVGKTRLLHDFLEELIAPDGPLMLAGRAAGASAGDALAAALRDALAVEGDPGERVRSLLPDMPEAAERLAAGMAGGAPPMASDELVTTWTALLRNLARERPLVLVLEDLHEAPPESVELVGLLGRALAEAPVLLLATFRDEELEQGSALHTLAATTAQRDEDAVLALEPMDRDTSEDLVRAVAGVERTVRLLSHPLHERSDGNPHLLLELLAHLESTGVLRRTEEGLELAREVEDVDLPHGVRELLARQLSGLDGDERALLEAAAAQGVEFDASLLAAVTGQRRIRLLKRLAVLERKHRVIASSGKNSFRFASNGLHVVVCDEMDAGHARELHAACADALLEDLAEEEGPPPAPTALAVTVHLLRSGRIGEAADLLGASIEHAVATLHPDAACALLEELFEAVGAQRAHDRLDLCLRIADLHERRGRHAERVAVLDRAREAAERLDEPAPRARVHAGLAAACAAAGEYDRADEEGLAGLELARAAGARDIEAACLQRLGMVAYRRGIYEGAAEQLRAALEIRRELGDRKGEASVQLALGTVLPELGRAEEAQAAKQSALDLYRGIGHRRGEGIALNNMANSMVDANRFEEALVCYEQAVRIARDVGDLPAEATARFNRGRSLGMLARFEEAHEELERALDIFRDIGDPAGEAEALDELGSMVATYGEREEALRRLEQAMRSAERIGSGTILARSLRHLANVYHEAGDTEAAWALYERALELGSSRNRVLTLADMGHAAMREGDHERAVELLERGREEPEDAVRSLLTLCRLARAHKSRGDTTAAEMFGLEAEKVLEKEKKVPPQYGPEIYYCLGTVFEAEERGRKYLETANEILGSRTRAIRSIVHRQNYLTMAFPNREILEEAKRTR